MITFGIPRGILTISNLAPILLYNPECPELQIREIPNNLGGLNTEYLVTKQRRREEKLWVRMPNDITLGFGGGGRGLLKDFWPIMRTFLFSDGVTGGGGGVWGGGLGWSTIEAFHSVKGIFFVCVLEESP